MECEVVKMKLEEENLTLFHENEVLRNSCKDFEKVVANSLELNKKLKENVADWKKLYESVHSKFRELCKLVQSLECIDCSFL